MKIVFNGQEFGSTDEMPAEVRQEYLALMQTFRDAEGGTISDALRRAEEKVVVDETITFNGREYKSRSDLPPEAQQLLEQLPAPQPGNPESRVEIKTRVLSPQIRVIESKSPEVFLFDKPKQPFPWRLVLFLLAVIGVLVWLWLSGTRPKDLLRH